MSELFPPNPEWSHVLFKLRVLLADPFAEVVRIVKHSRNLDSKFNSALQIDAAIEATSMSETERDNAKFGNLASHIFHTGHISLQSAEPSVRRVMLLYTLAFNESLPIHKSGIRELKGTVDFPQGVDALYISDSKEELNINPHLFRIKSSGQVSLQYEVEYFLAGPRPARKWEQEKIVCEYCSDKMASYYCPEERELFCAKCFEDSHRSARRKDHGKEPVTPYNAPALCPIHNTERLTEFCLGCQKLRCAKCIQMEASKPENKHTQHISLIDLATSFHAKQQQLVSEGKEKTKNLLHNAEMKIKELARQYESRQRDLEEKFASKLARLREESNRSMATCLSLHAELKRKYEQFIWLDSFMAYCDRSMSAESSVEMMDAFSREFDVIASLEFFRFVEKKMHQPFTSLE